MRRRLLITTALALPLASRAAPPPALMLALELRWVELPVSGAALAAAGQGGVVVGTAGSVSPRPGRELSTRTPEPPPVQRLRVLNGKTARLRFETPRPLELGEIRAELRPGATVPSRVWATTQRPVAVQSLQVRPQWPGGSAPVELEIELQEPGPEGGSSQWGSTVLLPLGDWVTVARSGSDARRPEPGTYSTRDAEPGTLRELQLRINRLP